MNGDDIVDVIDINNIVSIVLGEQPASKFDGRADVNGDGTVDTIDLNAVINIILGAN